MCVTRGARGLVLVMPAEGLTYGSSRPGLQARVEFLPAVSSVTCAGDVGLAWGQRMGSDFRVPQRHQFRSP